MKKERKSKLFYLFDIDGLYTGQYLAQESPEQPGVYIRPELSTSIPPVIKKGYWPVFMDEWVNIQDNRGIAYEKATGNSVFVEKLGDLDDSLTKLECPSKKHAWDGLKWTLGVDAVKQDKKISITFDFNAEIQKPITFNNTQFQCDFDSQYKLIKVLTALSANELPKDFYWVALDNTQVPVTLADLKSIAKLMIIQGWEAFKKLQDLKNQIDDCTTVDEINLIKW